MTFRLAFVNFLNHTGKICNVNCGHEVVSFSDNGKTERVLEPCAFKMAIEDGFSLSIKYTSRDNVGLDVFALEV